MVLPGRWLSRRRRAALARRGLPTTWVEARAFCEPSTISWGRRAAAAFANGEHGYFGSANLTSLGFTQHVEVGVRLSPPQCADMLHLLDSLIQAGLFKRR